MLLFFMFERCFSFAMVVMYKTGYGGVGYYMK